jgi:hypothetical protein
VLDRHRIGCLAREKIPVIGRAIPVRRGKLRSLHGIYRRRVFIQLDRILLSVIDDAIVHSPGSRVVHAVALTATMNLIQVVHIDIGLGGSLDPNRSAAGSLIRRTPFSVAEQRMGSSLFIHSSAGNLQVC